jgi:hypothetical protein
MHGQVPGYWISTPWKTAEPLWLEAFSAAKLTRAGGGAAATNDEPSFDDGQRRLELRRMGPAHTIGDAVAFLPREGILFTGDLCVNWRSGNNMGDRDADHPNWVRALKELATWKVSMVIPDAAVQGRWRLCGRRARLSTTYGSRFRQESGRANPPSSSSGKPDWQDTAISPTTVSKTKQRSAPCSPRRGIERSCAA